MTANDSQRQCRMTVSSVAILECGLRLMMYTAAQLIALLWWSQGRIMNRFSKDIGEMDHSLHFELGACVVATGRRIIRTTLSIYFLWIVTNEIH